MREDQRLRLQALAEKLAEVVLDEADPENWPGDGKPMAEWTQQERGDRYWCKKNAAASFSLWQRAEDMSRDLPPTGGGGGSADPQEPDLDKQIAQQEKKAADVLNDVMRRTRKAAFDSKTHGKA